MRWLQIGNSALGVVGRIFPVSREVETEMPAEARLLRTEEIVHMLRQMSLRICSGAVLALIALIFLSNLTHATTQTNGKDG